MPSRPSSTTFGSARADVRAPSVARVVAFTPREHALAAAANDNRMSTHRRVIGLVVSGLAAALIAGGGLYLYLI